MMLPIILAQVEGPAISIPEPVWSNPGVVSILFAAVVGLANYVISVINKKEKELQRQREECREEVKQVTNKLEDCKDENTLNKIQLIKYEIKNGKQD